MREKEKIKGMLSPYRVLDLTDEKGLLCGKLLGDLGADVIKIEKPGGDPARNIGPFYHDEVGPEKSLFWFAFNTSKRGITLDIETAEGQEVFKRLVKSADLVIESFAPGYMAKLGLGYQALESVNRGIIMVSITPFGQTGPYKDYKTPDIVAWAMGGQMYMYGDPDRAPLRISHHSQAYCNAAAEGAVGALVALRYREATGEGQWVDVSTQEAVLQGTFNLVARWDQMNLNEERVGTGQREWSAARGAHTTRIWPCKDGHIMWRFWAGPRSRSRSEPLFQWMENEGMGDEFLKEVEWETLDFTKVPQEVIDKIEEPTRRFFMTHTKAELFEGALKTNLQLYPVATTEDTLESKQLAARGFWVEVRHPELDTTITYPGAFARLSETPLRISRRAPLIGEHNQEVYEKELGLPKEELLKQAKDYLETSSKRNKPQRPLEGVKVVDFGVLIVGPLTAKILADYGAEVIKVESRRRLDGFRTGYPFKGNTPGVNRGGNFLQWNTSKLGITLNLATPSGIEIAKRLVARADVVIENRAGGAMKRMGLGYEELKKVKPDIIMLSSCMQGQTGPHAHHPGYGGPLTALTGFNYIAGWPDRWPVELGPYTDFTSPHFNLIAILAALDYRRRTGKGQYIDVAQYENGLQFMAPLILDYVVNRRVASTQGNSLSSAAPHGAYRCRGEDRWCVIAVFTDEEWESFCRVIGNPTWTKDPKFNTLLARKKSEDKLNKLVEEWTIQFTAEEVMHMMQTAGVAAGVVETGEDLLEHDPQLKHRHFIWELDHPEVGKHRVLRSPFVLSKSPCELRYAHLLGEHNEYVLKDILGMSDEEVAALVIEGVIE